MKWEEAAVRDEVIRLARVSTGFDELAARVSERYGETVSGDATRSASLRWRKSWPQIPPFADLFGIDAEQGPGPPPPAELLATGTRAPVPATAAAPSPPPVPQGLGDSAGPWHSDDELLEGLVICTSDHHHPISDRRAEAAILALAADRRPKRWVVNGDGVDLWWLSDHPKEAARLFHGGAGPRVADEFASFRSFISEAAGMSERLYVGEGNHDDRLSRFVDKVPALHGLPEFSFAHLLRAPGNVTVMGHGYRLKIGPVQYQHGDELFPMRTPSNPAGKALARNPVRSVIFGHTHRLEVATGTVYDEQGEPHVYTAINQGHLSSTKDQTYAGPEPNWQTGFVAIEYWTQAGKQRFTATPVPIVQGAFSYGGKVYRG